MRRYNFLHFEKSILFSCFALSAYLAPQDRFSSQLSARWSEFSQPAGIAAAGGLSKPVAKVGESVPFWLTVSNRTGQSIFRVRLLNLGRPEFTVMRLCWFEGPKESCCTPAQSESAYTQTCDSFAAELRSEESITVWGELLAKGRRERRKVGGVVGWTTATKSFSQVWVPLGECEVLSNWEHLWASVHEFGKDFALPIVLLVLGFAFQLWQGRREATRSRSETLWRYMLPIQHRLTTKFYMPLAARARAALSSVTAFQVARDTAESASARRIFAYLLMFELRCRLVGNSIGGFYFTDRVGEELAVLCLNAYRHRFWGSDAAVCRDLDMVLGSMTPNETLASLLAKIETLGGPSDISEAYKRCWTRFVQWLQSQNFVTAISYMKGFLAVLEYEMNRVYEYWYGRKGTLSLDNETESAILTLAHEADRGSFARVQKYVAESKKQSTELAY